jgi:predicted nucleic-acid-binding Zn-ribbon protein
MYGYFNHEAFYCCIYLLTDMNSQYIALGVKTDCRNLLKKFVATQSVRFKEFVKIWQDMKFSCIYCGQESFAELYEFIEEVRLCMM